MVSITYPPNPKKVWEWDLEKVLAFTRQHLINNLQFLEEAVLLDSLASGNRVSGLEAVEAPQSAL